MAKMKSPTQKEQDMQCSTVDLLHQKFSVFLCKTYQEKVKFSNNHRSIVTKISTGMKIVEKYAGIDLVLQELAFWTSHVNLAFAFNDVLLPRLKLRSNSGKLLTAFLNFSWEELVRRTHTSFQLMKQQKGPKTKQNQLGMHWCMREVPLQPSCSISRAFSSSPSCWVSRTISFSILGITNVDSAVSLSTSSIFAVSWYLWDK